MRSRPRAPKASAPSSDDVQQYRTGLRLLDKIRRQDEGPDEWIQFVSLILYACKKAIAWKPNHSYLIRERVDFSEFYGDLRQAKNGLNKLLKVSQRYKYKFDVIASFAENEIGLTPDGLIESSLGLRPSNDGLTRSLLQALMAEFDRPRAEMRRRYLERWNGDAGLQMLQEAGPLCFPGIIEGRKLPDLGLTGLQFELSFLLRRYTARLPTCPISRGDDIPAEGRPCHLIMAEFIRSSLAPEFIDDKGQAFLKVLRENRDPDGKGIVWGGWGVMGMAEAPGEEINLFGN